MSLPTERPAPSPRRASIAWQFGTRDVLVLTLLVGVFLGARKWTAGLLLAITGPWFVTFENLAGLAALSSVVMVAGPAFTLFLSVRTRTMSVGGLAYIAAFIALWLGDPMAMARYEQALFAMLLANLFLIWECISRKLSLVWRWVAAFDLAAWLAAVFTVLVTLVLSDV